MNNERPMMLDLLWVDGLTVRDIRVRRPGYWTIHPTFSNNVRVTGNDILTTGANTGECDCGTGFANLILPWKKMYFRCVGSKFASLILYFRASNCVNHR